MLDDAEDRVAGVAALLLGQAEQRRVLAVGVLVTGSADSATAGSSA